MPFAVDFLPVGTKDRNGGDAIAISWWDNYHVFQSRPRVVVIDGGYYKENKIGKGITDHVKHVYGTSSVNLVISTHPDQDHISGLRHVVENLFVHQLWMHRPWLYQNALRIRNIMNDGRITDNSLKQHLKDSLNSAEDLENRAKIENVKIKEPFSGMQYGDTSEFSITVLGPSEKFYSARVGEELKAYEENSSSSSSGELIKDSQDSDLLEGDVDDTSAINNTSTVILVCLDGEKFLFTGDAGISALFEAIKFAEQQQYSLSDLKIFDVPHHGSKRNLSSNVLKNIHSERAIVSAPEDKESDPQYKKHPAKKVTNALHKKGIPPYTTEGNRISYKKGCPTRSDEGPAEPLEFYTWVEE